MSNKQLFLDKMESKYESILKNDYGTAISNACHEIDVLINSIDDGESISDVIEDFVYGLYLTSYTAVTPIITEDNFPLWKKICSLPLSDIIVSTILYGGMLQFIHEGEEISVDIPGIRETLGDEQYEICLRAYYKAWVDAEEIDADPLSVLLFDPHYMVTNMMADSLIFDAFAEMIQLFYINEIIDEGLPPADARNYIETCVLPDIFYGWQLRQLIEDQINNNVADKEMLEQILQKIKLHQVTDDDITDIRDLHQEAETSADKFLRRQIKEQDYIIFAVLLLTACPLTKLYTEELLSACSIHAKRHLPEINEAIDAINHLTDTLIDEDENAESDE